jgi:hypothetical protein
MAILLRLASKCLIADDSTNGRKTIHQQKKPIHLFIIFFLSFICEILDF